MLTDPCSKSADARIRAALETIYREFAVAVPSEIPGCPCCIASRGVDVLLTTPLRELRGQALRLYVSGLFYTVGSACDFRYLLPRILDVSVTDPRNATNPEIVLGKLGLGNWQSWTGGERQAIEAFVDAWFERALAQDVAGADEGWTDGEAESVLCGAACAGFPLGHWISRLQEPFAAPVLADLRGRFPSRLSCFWDQAPNGLKELAMILA